MINPIVRHPWHWIMIFCAAIAIGIASFIVFSIRPVWLFPAQPLENFVWTSDPSHRVFYGPGTPESAAIVRRIKRMKEQGYLPDRDLVFDRPILITPALFTPGGPPDDVVIFSPFTPGK